LAQLSPISITRTCREPGREPGFATRFATSPRQVRAGPRPGRGLLGWRPGRQHFSAILTCRDWNSKSRTWSRTCAV